MTASAICYKHADGSYVTYAEMKEMLSNGRLPVITTTESDGKLVYVPCTLMQDFGDYFIGSHIYTNTGTGEKVEINIQTKA